ncbi:MAG: hypothetical protein HON65_01825 [Rhodospirillales bacterium]|jgi:hypothetical protein|nr:hypothetical protein [Rhodospirillales bacterium]
MTYTYQNLSKVLAGFALISFAAHASSALVIFQGSWDDQVAILFRIAGVLYYIFACFAIVGMWFLRLWGYISFYLYVILGTYLMGFSILPFIPTVFPLEAKFWPVMIINLLSVILVGWINWNIVKENRIYRDGQMLPK